MRDALYMAGRYLAAHRVKTAILIASITLVLYLPIGLSVIASDSAARLRARAEATPLLLGTRGSPVELVLSALYFESAAPEATSWSELLRIEGHGLGWAIPLDVRFRVRDSPIVGTSLDYFDFRGLEVAKGRAMATLGECVLGARAAAQLGVAPGDHVVSSPENVFDLAGVYPLKMRVVGVLAPSYSPDDLAVFTDVRTSWVIAGLGHGHQNLRTAGAQSGVLRREGDRIVANASVVEYNEITQGNLDSFHFHGSQDDYPLTAVLVVPDGDKAAALLRGRYQDPEQPVLLVRPRAVMEELLATVFTVQGYVVAAIGVAGIATMATSALVFLLSIRLRRREIDTLIKIGASRGRVAAILGLEIGLVLGVSAALAGILTLATARFGSTAIRSLLLS